jgi:hypothetical protein
MTNARRERRFAQRNADKSAKKGWQELKELGVYYQTVKDLDTPTLLGMGNLPKKHQRIIDLIIQEKNAGNEHQPE